MKNYAQTLLFTVAALISVNLLISCVQKGNSGGAPVPGSLESPGPKGGQNSTTTVDGTSDSGGGTGIDGKVFESYIVDPTQLPAYKQHLEPLFKNIKREKEDDFHFGRIFKVKTWYIAPVDLDKVGKDALGISFMKSETQQIARQTMKEVWIDQRIYNQMSGSDQSDLLLHELIMNMYFFKFMTMSEICRMSSMLNGEKDVDECIKNGAIFDKTMPPEKAHPLTDQDNENIRFVTGWLKQSAQKSITEKDFMRVLLYKGFDKRLFRPENYGEKQPSEEIKISRKAFYQAIKGTELSENMPTFCFAASNGKNKDCKVELEERSIPFQSFQIPGLNFRLSVENEISVDVSSIIGDEITLTATRDSEDSIAYTYTFLEWRDKNKIGDRVYSGILIFKKESPASQSGLFLESILIRPGIIVSIDKKRDPICQLRTPKVVKFIDEGISIRREKSTPGLVEQMFTMMPPFAACNVDNVTE